MKVFFTKKFSLLPWRTSLWLFTLWPAFLVLSQKYLLLYDLILGTRRRVMVKELEIAIYFLSGALFFNTLTLFLKYNDFSLPHFSGYFVFICYSLVLAEYLSNMKDFTILSTNLTRLNIFSLLMLYVVYFLEVDLSGLRGLNFIRGNDGEIHRFFVETSALFLISNFQTLRNRLLQFVFWSATLFYFVFIAKITFLIILFIALSFWKWLKMWPVQTFILGGGSVIYFFISGYYLNYIREDLILSILFKFEQFKWIVADFNISNLIYGAGFGFYITEFVTDTSQPYQIEMQFPMLVLQIGLVNVLLFILGYYYLFKSFLGKRAIFGLILYISVGFINPWLFLPVWFISSSIYTKLLFYD